MTAGCGGGSSGALSLGSSSLIGASRWLPDFLDGSCDEPGLAPKVEKGCDFLHATGYTMYQVISPALVVLAAGLAVWLRRPRVVVAGVVVAIGGGG